MGGGTWSVHWCADTRTKANTNIGKHTYIGARAHTHTHTLARATRQYVFGVTGMISGHAHARARAPARTHMHGHTHTHTRARARTHTHTVLLHVLGDHGRADKGRQRRRRHLRPGPLDPLTRPGRPIPPGPASRPARGGGGVDHSCLGRPALLGPPLHPGCGAGERESGAERSGILSLSLSLPLSPSLSFPLSLSLSKFSSLPPPARPPSYLPPFTSLSGSLLPPSLPPFVPSGQPGRLAPCLRSESAQSTMTRKAAPACAGPGGPGET